MDDRDKRPNRNENFEAVVEDKDANMTVEAAVVENDINVTVESVAMEKNANMAEYTPLSQKEPGTGSFQTSSDLGVSFNIGHCVANGLSATRYEIARVKAVTNEEVSATYLKRNRLTGALST